MAAEASPAVARQGVAPPRGSRRADPRRLPAGGDLVPLGLGVAAVAGGTALGWDPRLVRALVAPPPVARAALAGAALLVAVALLARAVERLGRPGGAPDTIRGVRLAFLAVAAAAAGIGWAVGSAMPLVMALVVGGVDVVETTFLLLLVVVRRVERGG